MPTGLPSDLPGFECDLLVTILKLLSQFLHESFPVCVYLRNLYTPTLRQMRDLPERSRVVMQAGLVGKLAAQTKAFNQVAIALDVLFLQVIEQAATLIHHAQQSAP